ncbi:hypothetical protein MMC12_008658, partial [Toensbergia leucococca]|nr:hypothetical protein [Toensbergia leucococca]
MFLPILFVLVLSLLTPSIYGTTVKHSKGSLHAPAVLQAPNPHLGSSHVLPLTRRPKRRDATHLDSLRARDAANNPSYSNLAPLTFAGSAYLVTINVGGQSFKADIDTGSSETWLVGPEFECSLGHGNTIRSECKFGPSYKPTSSFRTLDEVLSIAYGDNDGANGILGLERVTFAGITVEHQRIGVANKTEWKYGDGVSSGVIGLGPPRKSTRNPILRSIFAKNKVSPIFSLAISRDSDEN